MDWSRAKTILIIIFLSLNFFLIYNIIKQESKTVILSQNDISNIKSILDNNNIELKADILTTIKPQPFLRLDDEKINEDKVKKVFWGNKVNIIKDIEKDSITFLKENKT